MLQLLYAAYARRLTRALRDAALPRHVAMVMDGNRRWARQQGFGNPSVGHRYGAEHVEEVLTWCASLGIGHVTVFVASTDNLRKRGSEEVSYLMRVIEEVVAERLARPGGQWQVHVAGRLDTLPDSTREALKRAQETTCGPYRLTVAVGYDGRDELVDAVRSLFDTHSEAGTPLLEVADQLSADAIAAHLYTSGLPDPDLIIRTSGEQRLSGFLLWQAAYSELYFCDVYWPGFRKIDFLRALRSYSSRHRRLGA